MVKRRKTAGTPGVKAIEIKQERSPSGADDVLLARDRLKGVLQKQGRRDLGDDSSDSGNDETRGASDTPHPPPKKTVNINRKRKRTDANQEVAFHHTYVMKLFDRSVDLAQFQENTPLYPICRAWMANQPCAVLKHETEVKIEPEDDEKPEDENEDDDPSSDPENELAKTTYKMPPPIPVDETCERFPKIEPEISDALQTLNFDDPQAPSKETLLQEHLQRWSGVRSEWVASCIRNEERYDHSGRILRAIYNRAQRAYESF